MLITGKTSLKDLMDVGCLIVEDQFYLMLAPLYISIYETPPAKITLGGDGRAYAWRTNYNNTYIFDYPSQIHDILCPRDYLKRDLEQKLDAIYILREKDIIPLRELLLQIP